MNKNKPTIINYDRVLEQAKAEPAKFAKITEKKYFDSIQFAARKIADNIDKKRIVLVTGPSASGKTTTSHILMQELEDRGIATIVISMDDFFVGRDLTPKLPNGEYDFESIEAVEINLFKECLDNLITKGKSSMPVFNFIKGIREDNAYDLTISEHTAIIIEGIHAFNPRIISETMEGRVHRVYVCANSDFVGGEKTITCENLRFVRRMVRDFHHRGASVERTKQMWVNVRAGEEVNILPFKHLADFVIDTTHTYEPLLYKIELEKLAKEDENAKPYLENFNSDTGFTKDIIDAHTVVWEFLTKEE